MTEEARIPEPGEVLGGKYRLRRLLGEGGMGVVFEAEHLRLRQPIAIKFLNPGYLGVPEIVQRFDREARAAATLRSRHVVRVTDVEQTPDGVPYMVMELLEGEDLETQREQRGQMPFGEVVDYVLQACSALAEAHTAGIVHRDLKPANLFLAREDAGRIVVKILDFGISKFMSDDDVKLTSAGAIMGTALYMSPEQIRGDISIDLRSDIWSVGVILYELISGNAPWLGPSTRVAAGVVSEPAPDIRGAVAIPEALAQAIHWMLEKHPAKRPQSIADVATALGPFAPPGSIGAEIADHLVRRSQRHPRLAPGAVGGPVSAAPVSQASQAPASQRETPTSERIRLVVSTGVNPDRSTMAATTTSMGAIIARPRMYGALAAFGALALIGMGLIALGAKSSPAGGSVNPPPSAVVTVVNEPAPPVSKATEPLAPPATAPSSTAAPSASAAVASASRPSVGPAVGARPKPVSSVTASPPVAVTAKPVPPKPADTTTTANPLFLK